MTSSGLVLLAPIHYGDGVLAKAFMPSLYLTQALCSTCLVVPRGQGKKKHYLFGFLSTLNLRECNQSYLLFRFLSEAYGYYNKVKIKCNTFS